MKSMMDQVFAPTAPAPSRNEVQRQMGIIGLFINRLDQIIEVMRGTKPPEVCVNVPETTVNVAAPTVNVEQPVINVAQPDFKFSSPSINVDAPTVNVAAPTVNVQPAQVHVSAPNVSVEAPNVSVAAPSVNIPDIVVPYPKRLTFQHFYDENDNLVETVVTAIE